MDTTSRSATRDDLLTGSSPEVDPAVAAFLAQVRAEYRAPLPNEVVSGHLRMILAEAAVAPATPALRDRGARWARRIAAVGAVKVALTATAAAAATGTGLAATGSLPAPAQEAVADVAQLVGITLPTPASDRPAGRDAAEDGSSGIGEGGVPGLIESGATDLPGNTDSAPGLHKGDGRPDTPAGERPADERPADAADEHANTGGAERGADRADDRPEPATPDTARNGDAPAAERPAAPEERPAPPRGDADDTTDTTGTDTSGSSADGAGAPAGGTPPVERPERPEQGRNAGGA